MKTKFKKFSHSTVALLLTLCMMIACVNVGTITTEAWNDGTWRVWYENWVQIKDDAYGKDVTFDVDSSQLHDNNLYIRIKDENNREYGNNSEATYGNHCTASENSNNIVKLINAGNYSTVTIYITYTGSGNNHTCDVYWKGGTPKTTYYTATAGYVTGCDSMGTISASPTSVESGNSSTFTASPATNYVFDGWFDNVSGTDTAVSTSTSYTVNNITKNTTLYAKFHLDETLANTYYTVNFSSGSNGTVTAAANGSNITSGTQVKYGTQVTFTANPSTGYNFARWTGTNTGTTTPMTVTVQSAVNVKGSFTKVSDQGTSASGDYYFVNSTNINFQEWTNGVKVKYKNGRMYGYIDSVSNGTTYYFGIFTVQSPKDDTSNGEGKGIWGGWKNSSIECVTDFDKYVTTAKQEYKVNNDINKAVYYGKVTVNSSNVSQLIIDLGKWTSNNTPELENDTFRVIPVFNTDSEKLSIYAKDGSYRGDATYDFWNSIGETTLSGATNVVGHANFDTGVASRGQTITVTTVVNDTKYYVKGFSVNGVTPELYDAHGDDTYTLNYTIPADFEDDYLEITPIYYFKDDANTPTVNFVIENYDEALQATGWGNTLSVYPYYFVSGKDDLNNRDNAFGGYPGQPVINYGGRRFIQIPTSYIMDRATQAASYNTNYAKEGNTAIIKGITLSNDYWDIVHRDYVQEVDTHLQTYDYDDFYKIYKETSEGKEVNYVDDSATYAGRARVPDQITFAFKYRTALDNFGSTRFTDNGNGKKPETTPTTISNSIDISAYETSGNGWDKYLDYYDREINLFGRILTDAEKTNDPLYVVSSGYERTHAGYYATTWSVYNNDGSYIGTVTPSILEISSADRINTNNYPDSTGRGSGYPDLSQLSDFTTAYNRLKGENYVHRPVMITYEKALGNEKGSAYYHEKASEYSVRSDGRWYYSYYSDNITANIRIDYKDDPSAENWTKDNFRNDTNIGSHTGATAKFTNEGFDGATTMTALANINNNFTFTATRPGGYIFQGWWFERDGIATRVTENDVLNGQSAMTSNATFVARYVKSPSGTLTINHTLLDSSVGGGDTYIKVVAKKGEQETVLTSSGTDGFVKNQFEINSDYISYKSGYTFEITLKTVPDEYSTLTRFSEDTGNNVRYWDNNTPVNTLTPNTGVTETTFIINVDSLFTIDSETGFPTQTFDTLTYYSNLAVENYKYDFTYQYKAYVDDFGTLGATVRGTFSYDELSDYMTISSNALTFKSDADKTAFLNLVAPAEDNFMKDIVWITDDVVPTYNVETNTLSATIQSSQSDTTIKLNVQFPYEHKDEAGNFAAILTDGKATMKDIDTVAVDTHAPKYSQVLSFNEVKENFKEETPEYLVAPEVIYNGNTPYYFRYWSIQAKSDKHNLVEYTKSFNYEFDYVLFQDSTIKPVYSELTQDEVNNNVTPTPRYQLDKDDTGVTITFIENSRNQYNNGQDGDMNIAGREKQGDRIYSDFLISANNILRDDDGSELLLKDLSDDDVKIGLVVERVGELQKDENNNYYVEEDSAYKARYDSTIDMDNVISVAKGKTVASYMHSPFSVKELNNKNRINYYYNMPNRKHSDLTVSPYQYQVYRAFAYVRDLRDGGDTIHVSKVPVYFTIYEKGTEGNDVQPIG